MARLLLVRHAQSVWNAEGRAQGWTDVPLSAEGVAEAERLGRFLAGSGGSDGPDGPAAPAVSAVASSDLQRATHTARILAEATGCADPRIDARLRERELGWWSGLTSAEMAARWPREVEEWRDHRIARTPGGESTESVIRRATAALVDLAAWMVSPRAPAAGARGALLVVAHGGVISAIERGHGLSRTVQANLAGRWLEVGSTGLVLGDRFDPGEPAPFGAEAVETA